MLFQVLFNSLVDKLNNMISYKITQYLRIPFFVLLIPASLGVNGCITIYSLNTGDESDPLIYSGTRTFIKEFPTSGRSHHMGSPDFSTCVNVFAVVDLPFSFTLDTVLLPATIPMTILAKKPVQDDKI